MHVPSEGCDDDNLEEEETVKITIEEGSKKARKAHGKGKERVDVAEADLDPEGKQRGKGKVLEPDTTIVEDFTTKVSALKQPMGARTPKRRNQFRSRKAERCYWCDIGHNTSH